MYVCRYIYIYTCVYICVCVGIERLFLMFSKISTMVRRVLQSLCRDTARV